MRPPLAILLFFCACGGGTDATGFDAWLRVPEAQFIAAPLPGPAGGPSVLGASINRPDIAPGLQDRALQIVTEPSTSGILVGIVGDAGYWVVPAGAPDPQQNDQWKNQIAVVFSPLLPSGQFQLVVQAVSASGAAGLGVVIPLRTQDDALGATGLSFTLSWDTEADLDLHVVDASGTEIFWDDIAADGALLDFDSNQGCVIDGRRRERVTWASTVPPGHYQVRVDAPSLCSAPAAHWFLQAQRGGKVLATAQGEMTRFDTRGFHARGAGLLALELDVR
jgi:hypothetical protein